MVREALQANPLVGDAAGTARVLDDLKQQGGLKLWDTAGTVFYPTGADKMKALTGMKARPRRAGDPAPRQVGRGRGTLVPGFWRSHGDSSMTPPEMTVDGDLAGAREGPRPRRGPLDALPLPGPAPYPERLQCLSPAPSIRPTYYDAL